MKNTLPFLLLLLSFTTNAQNMWQKMTVSFRAGAIFPSYEKFYIHYPASGYRLDTRNHWNMEFSIEDDKLGLGMTIRYIMFIPGFIKNPIYNSVTSHQNINVGELWGISQDLSGFTFFVNKELFLLGKKHRIDFGLGTQRRKGEQYFKHEPYYWERYFDGSQPLDKHGLFSRLSYAYLINKHFSVSTNIEYARFKKRPTDLFFVNILAGIRF